MLSNLRPEVLTSDGRCASTGVFFYLMILNNSLPAFPAFRKLPFPALLVTPPTYLAAAVRLNPP